MLQSTSSLQDAQICFPTTVTGRSRPRCTLQRQHEQPGFKQKELREFPVRARFVGRSIAIFPAVPHLRTVSSAQYLGPTQDTVKVLEREIER